MEFKDATKNILPFLKKEKQRSVIYRETVKKYLNASLLNFLLLIVVHKARTAEFKNNLRRYCPMYSFNLFSRRKTLLISGRLRAINKSKKAAGLIKFPFDLAVTPLDVGGRPLVKRESVEIIVGGWVYGRRRIRDGTT